MGKFLKSACELLEIIKSDDYLGEHHPDVGRVYKDVATATSTLLAQNKLEILSNAVEQQIPKAAFSFDKAARFEGECCKKFREVEALYKH